ncbi:hypothetical protein CALVIDRAFT_220549 [Calocera viscosa TUFC12733]|uniref:receptor protein-tyrosine kinase n=1 Tax=Calocera viscosa (strain TUFC12733) TaxID=1330018 RepID=A0A167RK34_CALVF|nr:hypothetical protein CALVIDRAFT_220549 [Calocera viscosa TUFC12733]
MRHHLHPWLLGFGAVVEATLQKRGGPSGYLITPNDGTVWDNTNGIGLGHVQYQGVNASYSYEDITHVRTTSIDIYLSAEDGSTIYYLARGINPNPATLMVDESFSIPYASGDWLVVINETQECQTPDLPPIIFQAAAPTVTIISNSTSGNSQRRLLFEDVDRIDDLVERGGPSGTLQAPVDGTIWDDTNGFGSGRVTYQGVDQDYSDGDITHVTTHTVDVWFEIDDTSPPYILARGIAPKNLTVDVKFQIPRQLNGSYYLVINETQECQSPTLPPIIFRAAAPYITVLPTHPVDATTSTTNSLSTGAIVGAVVGGVVFLILIGVLIFLLLRQRRREKEQTEEREDSRMNRPDVPTSGMDPAFVITPFDLGALYSAPPEYTPSADVTPVSTASKARFSSTPTTPDFNRTSFGTFTTSVPTHSRTVSHARSNSGATTGATSSSSGYFDQPVQPLLVRSPTSAHGTMSFPPIRPSGMSIPSMEAPIMAQVRPFGLEPTSPQATRFRQPLEPVYEQQSEPASATRSRAGSLHVGISRYKTLPTLPVEEPSPEDASSPTHPAWTYTDSGAVQRANTYKPGDIIPQHFVGNAR